MNTIAPKIHFHDYHPGVSSLRNEVLAGLAKTPKSLAPKFFYDHEGSRLFDAICEQPEYYPTRTEIGILQDNARDIAAHIGPDSMLVEFGSGASKKIRILLSAVHPASYMGVDISKEFLLSSTAQLAHDYPFLEVHAACADFSQEITLPPHCHTEQTVAFFPGSSIGNFEPDDAVRFLEQMGHMLGSGGKLLVGVDLKKDKATLDAAYNDAAGYTAAFNLNVLDRIGRELNATIEPQSFSHRAFYHAERGRVEMHLVSKKEQVVKIEGQEFTFSPEESIHTENSYKYDLNEFIALAKQAGYDSEEVWMDTNKMFSVHLLVYR